MYLQQVLNGVACTRVGNGNYDITGLSCDTSTVTQGCLFFCLRGKRTDGHDFARKAVGDGAVALVVERPLDIEAVQFVVEDTRAAMALCAKNFYERAADKMKIVLVSGTNGKTSTTYLLDAIFTRAGYRTGVIGTNGVFFGGKRHDSTLTTPDPIALHKWLWQMYVNKVQIVFAEASAHAIALRKLHGVHAETSVFTNFGRDHLDYFETMDNYKAVKKSLFCPQYTTNAVVNIDDPVGREITSQMGCITYSVDGDGDVTARDVAVDRDGTTFRAECFGRQAVVRTNLSGRFNVYNALAALTVAEIHGVDLATSVAALEEVRTIDGRNQTFYGTGGMRVVVDFAHTPDGIDNILSYLRQTTQGKLIVVFGCGGNRDRFKRPLMAAAVSMYADFAVLTSDNPRYEEPSQIAHDAASGLTCPYKVMLNRQSATEYAFGMATDNDTVAVLGKGAETYQEIKGKRIYYSDVDVVTRLLRPRE